MTAQQGRRTRATALRKNAGAPRIRYRDRRRTRGAHLVGDVTALNAIIRQDRYRQLAVRLGKTVVLGGVHPTYCPEEALQYCDTIVCGEAEDLWPQAVADFEAGKMKRIYRMEQFPALDDYQAPQIQLLSPDAYMTRHCTFTTRGCHFDCEFCSVSPFNGKTTRRRPVPEVIEEMKRVKEWIRAEVVERSLGALA